MTIDGSHPHVALDARGLCPACLYLALGQLEVNVRALAARSVPGASGPAFDSVTDGAWVVVSFDGIFPAECVMVTFERPCSEGRCRVSE